MPTITNLPAVAAKAKTHQVNQVSGNHFTVVSGASDALYHIRLTPYATCSCEWAKYRPAGTPCGCSHVQAVVSYVASQEGYGATARPAHEDTRPPYTGKFIIWAMVSSLP